MRSDHAVQALTIAGGLVLASLLKQRLGLQGLQGADDCETWRQIAAGYRYSEYTDAERREASANWNATCQTAGRTDSQAASQAAAARLRSLRNPSPSDYPAYVIPAPECTDPTDGACTQCANRVLRYNVVAIENARRAYRRARCEYDCQRNTAAGHPEHCRDCSQFKALSLPERPACGGALVPANRTGGDIQIPSAAWVAAEPERFPVVTPETATKPSRDTSGEQKQNHRGSSGTTSNEQTPPSTGSSAAQSTAPELPEAITDAIDELPLPDSVKSQPWLVIAGALAIGFFALK